MAGTAVTLRQEFQDNTQVDRHRLSLNALVDDVDIVRRALNVTDVAAANALAAETDLMSYTIAANKLSAVGSAIRVKVWGTTANNANAKTLKVYFGGSARHTVSLTVSIVGRWVAEFQVLKTGASTQDWLSEIYEQTASLAAGKGAEDVGTATATDTATIIVKVTGTATANSDIVAEGMTVEYIPVAADLTAYKINTFDG